MGICIFAILSMEYIKFTHIAKMLVDMIFFFFVGRACGELRDHNHKQKPVIDRKLN